MLSYGCMTEEMANISEPRRDMMELDVSLRQAVLRDEHQVEHETNNGLCACAMNDVQLSRRNTALVEK
jgi:hypothetical protein